MTKAVSTGFPGAEALPLTYRNVEPLSSEGLAPEGAPAQPASEAAMVLEKEAPPVPQQKCQRYCPPSTAVSSLGAA